MDAVLLSAGVGSRFGALTEDKPKCLLKLMDKTIIEMQLDALFSLTYVDRVIVVVGFKADQIKESLKNYSDVSKVEFINNEDYRVTNNMYSLSLASHILKGREFISINGDVAIKSASLLKFSDRNESQFLFDSSRYSVDNMKVQTSQDGNLLSLSKNLGHEVSNGIAADVYKFSSDDSHNFFEEIHRLIQSDDRNQWLEVAIDKLCQEKKLDLKGIDIKGDLWFEIDNVSDLELAREIFASEIDLSGFEVFIFDLDGTLLLGSKVFDASLPLLKALIEANKKVYYVTNNSSYSDNGHKERLNGFSFPVAGDSVISSTKQTINYLLNEGYKKVFLLGTESASVDFLAANLSMKTRNPEIVVIANDTEITYDKLQISISHINNGIPYVVTHPDTSCPTEFGFMPDAGYWMELIKSLTGIPPLKVFGKPSVSMLDAIPRLTSDIKNNSKDLASKYVIVGDRLHFDIAMGLNSGISSILTLSGGTSELEFQNSNLKPLYVVNSVGDLLKASIDQST